MKGGVHPHLLRSTVATYVARERGTADAAALLGHKIQGGVTQRHYIERLRIAPDVSVVLQAVIDIGEEEAAARPKRQHSKLAAVAVADESTGW